MPTKGAGPGRARRICIAGLFLIGVAAGQSVGEVQDRALTGSEIVARMIEMDQARIAQLREYISQRRYFLENKRFHARAETGVRMTYRQSGAKEFAVISESGPVVIHEKVLHRLMDSELEASREPIRQATRISPGNYDFRFVGVDSDRARRAYLFEISPKVENKFMIRGRIWVDAADFAITRIEGRPAKNPSFLIKSTSFVHTYQKCGPFWVPAANVSNSDSIFFGRTSIEIQYKDYQINPGEQ